jgi:hypothetical protein
MVVSLTAQGTWRMFSTRTSDSLVPLLCAHTLCKVHKCYRLPAHPTTLMAFYSMFSLAGLSLLGYTGFSQIDPVYALPVRVCKRLGLRTLYKTD